MCDESIRALLPFDDGYLYPDERAQLLRKENAKALHLVIEGEEEWCEHALSIIHSIKEVVDVPTAVSLHTLPDSMKMLDAMVAEGIYRIILPQDTAVERIQELIGHLSPQRVVPSSSFEATENFEALKQLGVQRVALIHADDKGSVDWERLGVLAEKARTLGLRLTVLFGIRSYAELHRLDGFAPVVDSLVLGHALEEDVFPCQKLWRSVEVSFGSAVGAEANLWVNPIKESH